MKIYQKTTAYQKQLGETSFYSDKSKRNKVGTGYYRYGVSLDYITANYNKVIKAFKNRLSMQPLLASVPNFSEPYQKSIKLVVNDTNETTVYFKIAGSWGRVFYLPAMKATLNKKGLSMNDIMQDQYEYFTVGDILFEQRSVYDENDPYVYSDMRKAKSALKKYLANNYDV